MSPPWAAIGAGAGSQRFPQARQARSAVTISVSSAAPAHTVSRETISK